MFKRIFKWFGTIIAVVAIAIAVFLINLIWFRPWSLNLFYEKVFAEILFDHPEILSTLGLVEQFGITGHNGKLDDESPAHQQRESDRWKRDLAQLRQYPLDRQSPSPPPAPRRGPGRGRLRDLIHGPRSRRRWPSTIDCRSVRFVPAFSGAPIRHVA